MRVPLAILLLAAGPALAQPADSVAVRHTLLQQPGPPRGPASSGILIGAPAPPPRSGPPRPEAWERALAQEVGGMGGGGTGGVLLTLPVRHQRLGASAAAGLSATAVLGVRRAAGGLFASAGISDGLVAAQAGVGGWAETSPRGRALGPAVEARVRLAVVRAEAGAVVAGARARWLRVGLDLPVLAVGSGVLAFVGVAAEARRFEATGQTLRTVAVSLTL